MLDHRLHDHNHALPLYLTSAMPDHNLPDLTSSSLPGLRLTDHNYASPLYLTSAMLDHRLPDLTSVCLASSLPGLHPPDSLNYFWANYQKVCLFPEYFRSVNRRKRKDERVSNMETCFLAIYDIFFYPNHI
jgi:hypothetical protein